MLCRAYTSTRDAEQAIEGLLAAGVPATGIQLITGEASKDSREAPLGTFAGTAPAAALILGSYAGIAHSARDAAGTFAGDPDAQRRGAFGDTDRDTVTTYRSAVRRTRIASHHALVKLLVDAGLARAIATANVSALHAGRVLVLVHDEAARADLAAAIDGQPLRAAA